MTGIRLLFGGRLILYLNLPLFWSQAWGALPYTKMEEPFKKYTCVIIDDDELDRLMLVCLLQKYSFIQIIGVYESGEMAIQALSQGMVPDILFLDIDMPGMNGLSVRLKLDKVPACIFVSSHPEFALECFEANALDFIMKPLNNERFQKAMLRLRQYLEIRHKANLLDHTLGPGTLFIKDGHKHIKIQLHEIWYLEALKDYTGIIIAQRRYCVLSPLGKLLKEASFQSFIRIHRSYAIQKHFIKKFSSKEVTVENVSLPVGRSFWKSLEQTLLTR